MRTLWNGSAGGGDGERGALRIQNCCIKEARACLILPFMNGRLTAVPLSTYKVEVSELTFEKLKKFKL